MLALLLNVINVQRVRVALPPCERHEPENCKLVNCLFPSGVWKRTRSHGPWSHGISRTTVPITILDGVAKWFLDNVVPNDFLECYGNDFSLTTFELPETHTRPTSCTNEATMETKTNCTKLHASTASGRVIVTSNETD